MSLALEISLAIPREPLAHLIGTSLDLHRPIWITEAKSIFTLVKASSRRVSETQPQRASRQQIK